MFWLKSKRLFRVIAISILTSCDSHAADDDWCYEHNFVGGLDYIGRNV